MTGSKRRLILQIFGGALVVALVILIWLNRNPAIDTSVALGEEVYASHDCTDCHLSESVLTRKREKKELGLIRVRKDQGELLRFLESDKRHRSFVMISAEDRKALIAYLRTLVPPD